MNGLNDERMMYKTTIDKRIVELEEENKKLRKALNDCEKFRYQVFKRIGELHNE